MSRAERLSILFHIDEISGRNIYGLPEHELDSLQRQAAENVSMGFADMHIDAMVEDGIRKDPELIQYLKDSIVFGRIPLPQAQELMTHFNQLFPEFASSLQAIPVLRGLPPPDDGLFKSRGGPWLWLDLEHLEQEALGPIADAQGQPPIFLDREFEVLRNEGLFDIVDWSGQTASPMSGVMDRAIQSAPIPTVISPALDMVLKAIEECKWRGIGQV
jgi:hypothetical protein